MAFADPFDVLTPEATAAMKDGDDRIRELKRALHQRLVQILAGWPDTDPLKVLYTAMMDSVNLPATVTATATTAFNVSVAEDGVYTITAKVAGQASIHSITATIAVSSTGSVVIFNKQVPAGGTMDITNVAGAIKVTHNVGTNQTILATLRRIL